MYNAIIMTVMYTFQNLMYAVTVNNDIAKSDQHLTKHKDKTHQYKLRLKQKQQKVW